MAKPKQRTDKEIAEIYDRQASRSAPPDFNAVTM